jgi:hypothetical protein
MAVCGSSSICFSVLHDLGTFLRFRVVWLDGASASDLQDHAGRLAVRRSFRRRALWGIESTRYPISSEVKQLTKALVA